MCGQPILVIYVITKGKGREGTEGRKEGKRDSREDAAERERERKREREIKYTRADTRTRIFAREERGDAAKCEMYGAF